MRLKHNKKRNTAFVYEALVRELTESVVKNNKNKQNKIVSILKDHFTANSVLKEELDLYKSIYETRHIEKSTAEKIVYHVKEKHDSLDKKKLFQEQSALINKINRILSNKVYNKFVPNYKTIASVYSIFQDALPVKDRVLLEENIVQHMSASIEERKTSLHQPIDSLVYKTFVNNFNEEYSDSLNEGQKKLLGQYISSFADNGSEFKLYLNEEIGDLKSRIKKAANLKDIKSDFPLKEKLDKIYNILDETKNRVIDTKTIEIVLSTQDLLEELEKDDD
tara:strand:+ start:21085 stop:21918 length:834 start_codon:yes stop_codon:yes gene_type:complete